MAGLYIHIPFCASRCAYCGFYSTTRADMQDSYIVRAGHPDGKDNKALVRNYYRKLREDLQNEVNAIADEIGELSKDK